MPLLGLEVVMTRREAKFVNLAEVGVELSNAVIEYFGRRTNLSEEEQNLVKKADKVQKWLHTPIEKG